jgi:hypothetical protein
MKGLIKKLLREGLDNNPNLLNDLKVKFSTLRRNSHSFHHDSKEYKDIKNLMKVLKEKIKAIEQGPNITDTDELKIKAIEQGPNITDTDEFKRWFSGSKVVDSDGNPRVVYHGTTASAAKNILNKGFDLSMNKFGPDSGIHFMTKKEYTKPYNKGGLIRAYVSLKNPMSFDVNVQIREEIINDLAGKPIEDMTIEDWEKYTSEISTRFRNEANRLGYDGVYDSSQVELMVLNPEDIRVIKSDLETELNRNSL